MYGELATTQMYLWACHVLANINMTFLVSAQLEMSTFMLSAN